MRIKTYNIFDKQLSTLKNKKLLISTINAHSYNISRKDTYFREVLMNSDVLIPDGVSVIWAIKWLTGKKLTKIAGADLFFYEMERLQQFGGKVFFIGSSETTLSKIRERARKEYPYVEVFTYSPPYKPEFTEDENHEMISVVNEVQPDVLFVGMTAPKQEKWAYRNFKYLEVGHIGCIGAVFDFYAGTVNRAPQWMISTGFEWFYRLVKEPRRMWRRYIIGNVKFVWYIIAEKLGNEYKIHIY